MKKLYIRILLACHLTFASTICIAATKDDAIWLELIHVMHFVEINRAQIEFGCKNTLDFSNNPILKNLCKKRHLIPARVIEEAALPYLQRHVTIQMAKAAIAELSSESSQVISRKLVTEIASGKRDQLSPIEIEQLRQQMSLAFYSALKAFTSDREQGLAVSRAMIAYEP